MKALHRTTLGVLVGASTILGTAGLALAATPGIELRLGVDFEEARARWKHRHLIFTGAIDEYFGRRFGALPYRSLRFEHESFTAEQLRDEVSRHWHVDEVRPASLVSAAAKLPDGTVVTAVEPDAQGRVELPADLVIAHT